MICSCKKILWSAPEALVSSKVTVISWAMTLPDQLEVRSLRQEAQANPDNNPLRSELVSEINKNGVDLRLSANGRHAIVDLETEAADRVDGFKAQVLEERAANIAATVIQKYARGLLVRKLLATESTKVEVTAPQASKLVVVANVASNLVAAASKIAVIAATAFLFNIIANDTLPTLVDAAAVNTTGLFSVTLLN